MTEDQRLSGFVLFLLGGLTGTLLASRWARRSAGSPVGIEGLQSLLDETVEGVEAAASYVRALVEPVHDLLDEAGALASGVRRTVHSYRRADAFDVDAVEYVAPNVPGAPRGSSGLR
jgi:hypothetical protein